MTAGATVLWQEADAPDLSPARLVFANIHPDTLLATDYLNHFNEVVMLIDMLPSMPDCAGDVLAWAPRSYEEHFRISRFKERDLAIAAYEVVDPLRRSCFEATIRRIERAMGDLQRLIAETPDAIPYSAVQDLAETRVKPLLAHAMGLINGAPAETAVTEDGADAQLAVDALFE